MLEFSPEAKFATSVFYECGNDWDVYIEDEHPITERIYLEYLRDRLAKKNLNIEKIFPLGGRDQVIKQASSSGLSPSRISIFIIDGDLHLLTGGNTNLPSNVVALDKYCIENYLVDEDAIFQFLDEEDPEKNLYSNPELQSKVSINAWKDSCEDDLRNLYIAFALSISLDLGIKTIDLGHNAVSINSNGDVCNLKVNAIIERINSEAKKRYSEQDITKTWSGIESRIERERCFISTYVSGKDFIFPLFLHARAKQHIKIRSTASSRKLRLAKFTAHAFEPIFQKMCIIADSQVM